MRHQRCGRKRQNIKPIHSAEGLGLKTIGETAIGGVGCGQKVVVQVKDNVTLPNLPHLLFNSIEEEE